MYLLVAPRASEVSDELPMLRRLVEEFTQKKFWRNQGRRCQLHRRNADSWTMARRIGILLANEHGNYNHMTESPMACKWIDKHVDRIHAGANEIMMEMTGTSR